MSFNKIRTTAPHAATDGAEIRTRDPLRRSMLKAVSWRILGSLDTFILSLIVIKFSPMGQTVLSSGNSEVVQMAGYIAAAELITKLMLFTLHERVWARVNWGRTIINGMHSEERKRSALKSFIWRVIAFIDTSLLALLFTGSLSVAFTIGVLEILTKIFLYYLHERAWLRIRFV